MKPTGIWRLRFVWRFWLRENNKHFSADYSA